MKNELLIETINSYFNIYPPPFFSFDIGNKIPIKKLKNISKLYAFYDSNTEEPLILIDDTLLRSAKLGVLITTSHLFYRLLIKRDSRVVDTGRIPIINIKELRIDIYKRGSDLVVNGKKIGFMVAFGVDDFKRTEAEILNRLFEQLINSLHSNS